MLNLPLHPVFNCTIWTKGRSPCEIWIVKERFEEAMVLRFETLNLRFCELKLWELTIPRARVGWVGKAIRLVFRLKFTACQALSALMRALRLAWLQAAVSWAVSAAGMQGIWLCTRSRYFSQTPKLIHEYVSLRRIFADMIADAFSKLILAERKEHESLQLWVCLFSMNIEIKVCTVFASSLGFLPSRCSPGPISILSSAPQVRRLHSLPNFVFLSN